MNIFGNRSIDRKDIPTVISGPFFIIVVKVV